ncbi:hypothetical protein C8R43DRAFT_231564 [Mycena crocata]|nr:hypothetical protein C8R43DRAFT_231564 [Mycena crocata]
MFINPPAAKQTTLPCTFVIPAFSLLPLLGLLILCLVMKRKRPSSSTSDPEDQGWDVHCEKSIFEDGSSAYGVRTANGTPDGKVPRRESPPRKKQRSRKAIPRRMLHMKDKMSVWGDRWLPAIPPSTAGSQQGEIDPSGTYTASGSPPPAYRTTPSPLSPVVMTAISPSPHSLPLSSDFKFIDDSVPLLSNSQGSPYLDGMFLFGDNFNIPTEPFGFSKVDESPSYCNFSEDPSIFDFTADASSSNAPLPHHALSAISSVPTSSLVPPCPQPFSNPMDSLDLRSIAPLSSHFNDSYPYSLPGGTSFSDWIPPSTTQHSLPLDNVAHYQDGHPYNHSFSFSPPSQNTANYPATAWGPNNVQYEARPSAPTVAGYSPTMYTGHGSPYLAMSDGSYSPVYHRSSSGSPLALYSGQPHYHPLASSSRTASSGSISSLYSMDRHSPHSDSMMFSRAMPGPCSDYNDFDYNHPSPHSAIFTGSPNSVSSAYGALDGPYPVPSTSRTIPLPFNSFHNPPPHPNWSL